MFDTCTYPKNDCFSNLMNIFMYIPWNSESVLKYFDCQYDIVQYGP
jgi:hypothetical protein